MWEIQGWDKFLSVFLVFYHRFCLNGDRRIFMGSQTGKNFMTHHFASRVTSNKINVKTIHNNERSAFGTWCDHVIIRKTSCFPSLISRSKIILFETVTWSNIRLSISSQDQTNISASSFLNIVIRHCGFKIYFPIISALWIKVRKLSIKF